MSCWLTSTSVSDPKSIADAFNDYFISIGSRLAAEYVDESCSNVDNQPINYNINQSSDTFLNYLQYPLIVLPRP